MTTKNTTQSKSQNGFGAFRKMMDDGFERLDTFYSEIGRHHKQGIEQAGSAIDEMARVAKDSMGYTSQFADEVYDWARQATRRTAEMWGAVLTA